MDFAINNQNLLATDVPPAYWIALKQDEILVCGNKPQWHLPTEADLALPVNNFTVGTNGGGATYGAVALPADFVPQVPLQLVTVREFLHQNSEAMCLAVNRAKILLFWRSRRQYCGRCGALLSDAEQETARRCPKCQAVFYPVLAPAVIVRIRKGESLLLARNAKFKTPFFGLIAGFVESGESLEQAVQREIREEVGIEVTNIKYFDSQPWPYPNSLMMGFTADYCSGEITPDGTEIVEAKWFDRTDLPPLPSPGSIARRMLDDFWGKLGDRKYEQFA